MCKEEGTIVIGDEAGKSRSCPSHWTPGLSTASDARASTTDVLSSTVFAPALCLLAPPRCPSIPQKAPSDSTVSINFPVPLAHKEVGWSWRA